MSLPLWLAVMTLTVGLSWPAVLGSSDGIFFLAFEVQVVIHTFKK